MNKRILILIEREPIAWARPGQNGRNRYDTQRDIKNDLGRIILSQLDNQSPLLQKISLQAEFHFRTPNKMKDVNRGGYHWKKPDIDNLLKFYLDLCQECGCFKNDSQICDVSMKKKYAWKYPYVSLCFTEI